MKFLVEDLELAPFKANPDDAGWDLRCAHSTVSLEPGERVLVSTGVRAEIPIGMAGFIWPRSGLAFKNGIDVMAGLIDAGYRGEIKALLINHSNETQTFSYGDRVAQLVVAPIYTGEVSVVDSISESTRSENGFGSSGVR